MHEKVNLLKLIISTLLMAYLTACNTQPQVQKINQVHSKILQPLWAAPDTNTIPLSAEGNLIRYGKNLVTHTAVYFGPSGNIAPVSNGMNCQNCHLDAGTRLFGNNFSLVASAYPKYKDRSGRLETIVKKVNDCFERSMNGKAIDTSSREMKAFVAYLQWVGKGVKPGAKLPGSGIEELPFLNRAADTAAGHVIYTAQCAKCHQANGDGVFADNGKTYIYPPLFGGHSYNTGASMYRISKLAGFIKNNMPFGCTHDSSSITVAAAWDVAAFINSQKHPYKEVSGDWPVNATKPYDYPFGPYADNSFTETQHKYGPYADIKKWYNRLNSKK